MNGVIRQKLAVNLGVAGRDPRILALAVLAATACLYLLPRAPAPGWFLAPLALCALRFPGRALALAAALAAAWAAWSIAVHEARLWPAERDGRVAPIAGRVVGLPVAEPRRTRFMVATRDPARRLRLSWYDHAPALVPGDCVAARAKLDTPHGSANPGGFDYEAWLWRNDIHATGYVKQPQTCGAAPRWTLDRLRFRLRERLGAALADSPMRGVVQALALGARSHITDAQWRVLRRTGTTHLVAISGLHIGLIAGWLFFIARWLALRLRRLRPEPTAAVVSLAGATGYAALAGWALPTQRALIMVAVALAGAALFRDVARSRLLGVAAIAVIAVQPAAVIAPGFWLSFAAVAWILYLIRPGADSRLLRALFVQCGVIAGLMPLTLYFFGQASLIAPLVNAIAIPLASIFVPAVLVASAALWLAPAWGAPFVHGVAAALNLGWQGLAGIAGWPLASVRLGAPDVASLVLAVAGLVWLWAPRGVPARWLAVVLLLPAVIGWQPRSARVPDGGFILTVLDVGQGSASVVQTRTHTLVFDAGPAYGSGFDAGRMIVAPYLRRARVARLDALVLSHSDLDHAGGAAAIGAALPVERRRGAGSPHPCRAGQRWRWDGVVFRFVYPDARAARRAPTSNARSCVLRITADGHSVLLTGDIERAQERRLIAREPDLASDVLVVAHHGSATSSSRAFVGAVAPRWALISAGWHNRWGFPKAEVVTRLRVAGARIANTACSGALTVRVGARVQVSRWRRVRRRLWQRPRACD